MWDYTIGLVGKPSAGKSTFFNAATDPASDDLAAKVAAHPFTTINPNIGRGLAPVLCPCHRLPAGQSPCGAPYGHTAGGQRLVPITLKDVAGLVPGAWQGRGKGNKFLDDLCDADVLCHIVDASGETNREGVTDGAGGDPLEDIEWVREELHHWIFANLRHKWDAIRRTPQKLLRMFTGYHCKDGLVWAALQRAGLDPRDLNPLREWGSRDVHRLVAHFLRLRFPILLVLNKMDHPQAGAHISRIRDAHPLEPISCTSARAESTLCSLRRQGQVQYPPGGRCNPSSIATPATVQTLQGLGADQPGATGVLAALAHCLALRPPVAAFPCADLDTLGGLVTTAHRGAVLKGEWGARPVDTLWHCLLLRPGTTVEDLFAAIKRPPHCMLEGDYVRAECRQEGFGQRPLKKTEPVDQGNSVLRFWSNRKVQWQKPR